jgi:hypothetical protein
MRDLVGDMNHGLSESAIIRALAEQVCQRLTRKIIATLQGLNNELLSGEDSPLKNTWDEICVQVQFEASFSWEAYDETVRGLANAEVEELLRHEREAVWLQTSEADRWDSENEFRREPYPVVNDDVVEYLMTEYIYCQAANWSNRRIREYLDGA